MGGLSTNHLAVLLLAAGAAAAQDSPLSAVATLEAERARLWSLLQVNEDQLREARAESAPPAGQIPPGAYQKTCTGCEMYGDALTCQCQTVSTTEKSTCG